MVKFEPGKPIETREAKITVDGGLPVGTHLFSLIVVDSAGNESRRDIRTVVIRQGQSPPSPPSPPRPNPPNRPSSPTSPGRGAGDRRPNSPNSPNSPNR